MGEKQVFPHPSRREYGTVREPGAGKGQGLANCITRALFLIKALGFGSREEADGRWDLSLGRLPPPGTHSPLFGVSGCHFTDTQRSIFRSDVSSLAEQHCLAC